MLGNYLQKQFISSIDRFTILQSISLQILITKLESIAEINHLEENHSKVINTD